MFWWNLLIIRSYLHRKFNIRNLYINLMNLWNITMMRVEDQDEQLMGILKYLTEWLVNHILYVDGQIPKG